jgi:hypothetical protein
VLVRHLPPRETLAARGLAVGRGQRTLTGKAAYRHGGGQRDKIKAAGDIDRDVRAPASARFQTAKKAKPNRAES